MLVSEHSISLASCGLPVHENGGVAALEKFVDDLGAALRVYFPISLIVFEDIVEVELVDVIHLDFALLPGASERRVLV